MKKITQCFSVLIIAVLFSLTYAGSPDKSPATKTTVEENIGSLSERAEEVAILKAQVATMREFNQHILTTVYWSLGTIVVIAALLVGFGWFTNYKIHERELASLKQELMNALENRINAFVAEFTKNSYSTAKQLIDQAVKAESRESKEAIASIQGQISTCTRSISDLRFEALRGDARYWELRGAKGNVLDRYREMLEMAIQRKDELEIASSIDGLKKLISEGTPLFHLHIGTIVGLMDTLPAKLSMQADALKTALKSAKTY